MYWLIHVLSLLVVVDRLLRLWLLFRLVTCCGWFWCLLLVRVVWLIVELCGWF